MTYIDNNFPGFPNPWPNPSSAPCPMPIQLGSVYTCPKPTPLDKLPAFNNDWNQELRLAWFQAFIAACTQHG